MAAEVGFKVEGLTQVVRSLKAMGLDVDDLKTAFSEIAKEGAEVAAKFAPHVTGLLAGDIRGNRAQSKAVVTAGRASVPYAGPINYGWGRGNLGFKTGKYATGIKGEHAGSFFMQKADLEMRPVAIERLESEINKLIREKGLDQ